VLNPMEGTSLEDYTAKVIFDGSPETVMTGNEEGGMCRYTAAEIYAYQMTLPVTVRIYYKNVQVKECVSSVRSFCVEAMAANSGDTALVQLCRAALAYGAAAQRYFKDQTYGNETPYTVFETVTEEYADAGLQSMEAPECPDCGQTVSGSLDGFGSFSTTLVLGSTVSLKVCFSYTGDQAMDTYSFSCGEDFTVSAPTPESENRWYVTISGFDACNLSSEVLLTVSNASQSLRICCSPYAFAASQWFSENALLKELCRALVRYGNVAKLYAEDRN